MQSACHPPRSSCEGLGGVFGAFSVAVDPKEGPTLGTSIRCRATISIALWLFPERRFDFFSKVWQLSDQKET